MEHRKNNSQELKHLPQLKIEIPCTEYLSMKGLWKFCAEKKLLVFTTALAILFAYAAKLFFYNIGTDTELYIADGGREETWSWWIQLGRYGLVALQRAFDIFHSFDPVAANWLAGFFMLCAGILWSRLFFVFSHGKIQDLLLILFSVLFVTNPIWTESIYFTLQVVPTMFAVALCPLAVQFFFCGFADNKKTEILGGVLLLAFLISIYQAVLPLFCCGVLAAFLLLVFCAESDGEKDSASINKSFFILCLKLFVALVVSVALYFALGAIIKMIFHAAETDYLTKQLSGKNSNPDLNRVVYFCTEVYKMTVAKIPFVQNICGPIMASHARSGWEAVENIHSQTDCGSILFLPLLLIALVFVVHGVRAKKYSALSVFAVAGIFICAFFFPLLARGGSALRTYWAFPLALSFLYLFCILMSNKKLRTLLLVCAVVSCFWQIKLTAQLFTSDLLCFRQSEELARDIYARVQETESGVQKPLVLIGAWKWSKSADSRYLLRGDVAGHSVFEWNSEKINSDATRRGTKFMQVSGFPVVAPAKDDTAIFDAAQKLARDIPSYPDKDCVVEAENFILVKLSETTYEPEN